MKRLLLLMAMVLAGCSARKGVAPDDPVSRLFEDNYPEFVGAAGPHHAGCEVELVATGEAGAKSSTLTSSVDVDATGNYRLTQENGAELLHSGTHSWTRGPGGKPEPLEDGSGADLERDAAVAEWRSLLEPLRDRVKLKAGTAKKLGTRQVQTWALTLDKGGAEDGPKVDSGAGTFVVDTATGFPVQVSLKMVWNSPAPAPATGRVSYELEKMECNVTLGPPAKALDIPQRVAEAMVTAAPTATPTATPKPMPKPARTAAAKPSATAKPSPTAKASPKTKHR